MATAALCAAYPELDEAPIRVHFHSSRRRYRRRSGGVRLLTTSCKVPETTAAPTAGAGLRDREGGRQMSDVEQNRIEEPALRLGVSTCLLGRSRYALMAGTNWTAI